ncbi:acetylornithine transaminase [Brevibacillus laterosporus]|uniref:aspartate aminotransferase family protein n=1 Tax=Brevibacillus laterosporus TaxID=1465 RepID=UPI00112AF4C7|nr:acetylornithine transaminase [Brevibacillus laterosporus]MBG9801859.1 acetylornithine aminotransferase [Brevibacillus laterosporus]MED4762597.1 acetylornithine transaminase [Brevibacillus laterosporus]TPH18687.1 aminotransferase class III-fold pyridoxal phosphate-dependent enzyme [Brevibacillus laterosporus]
MTDWLQKDETYLMSTYKRLPIAIEKGEGNYLLDTEGKAYLDLFTGLAVSVLGHSHPKIVEALVEQGEKFLHISNIFLNKPAITLAEQLVKHTIPGKVFFSNSGAEATEAAIKIVHKWAKMTGRENAGVVVLKNSFHGRTLGAVKLTRQAHVYQDYPLPTFPVYEVAPGDIEGLQEIITTYSPVCLLMEPVLGSGGVIPLSEHFLEAAFALCKERDVLYAMDEIQTGMGRTGKLFAYQHTSVQPDLILFAKGVGGGLPLGGVIAGEKLANLFKPGDHGTTFAPSPLSAALGNAVMGALLKDGLLDEGKKQADYLWDRIAHLVDEYPQLLSDIRGKGMMLGIQTKLTPEEVSQVQKGMLEAGFLIDVTQKTIIRLLPPLTLTSEEIDQFMVCFREVLEQTAHVKGEIM